MVLCLFRSNGPQMPDKNDHFSEMREQRPLSEFPGEFVNVACTKCDRAGKLSKARLIQQYGGNMGLVNLLNAITMDCTKAKRDSQLLSYCGAHYPDLKSG